MAVYPVINKETGEQKEVKMSVHDWDQWKVDNPDWERDYSDHPPFQTLVKLEKSMTNSGLNILDGMKFSVKHQKHLVPT